MPGRFTQNERIRRAIGLLVANPSLTTKQISGMSSFVDPNYFAKVFRKQFAVSPSKFQRRGMIAWPEMRAARERPLRSRAGQQIETMLARRVTASIEHDIILCGLDHRLCWSRC